MKKIINITIRDNRKDLILKTNSENYKKDLENNKDVIKNIWWLADIEYTYADGSNRGFVYRNGWERKVVNYEQDGKTKQLYAEYNFANSDGKDDKIYDKILKALDEDFRSDKENQDFIDMRKEQKKKMMETKSPENTNIKPVEENIPEELFDVD